MSTSDDPAECALPVKRRRSSVLRRMSVAPALASNSGELAHKQYVLDAQQEARDWIDLVKQRRQQAKISEAALEQISAHPPTLTFDDCKDDLRPEDLEFLAQRPDYKKISSETDNYLEKVGILKTKFENVDSLVNFSELLIKCRVNSITSNICSYNEETPLKPSSIP